ncbi:flagellar motor switch protein FliN [Leptospira sp. GIMC2001]|uniref:flagellar motor switch protein FliN n=1 Tax=Leptospira sp. GIMC2001 TaxID=1513297 RepID=UPI0004A5C340|nr:flagellar motor switch protein FliN [Leptospira sp. GIMC2001]AID56251.1 flagellar motor switch protein [Leptospira sp. GIMC2001]WCL47863.1 flagellar motor switch protein FliN [Leptospira sp. GIMC2001]
MGEGSLSQEDIDALLGGGDTSGSGKDALADLDALVGGGGGGSGDSDGGPSFADIAAALGPSATPSAPPPRAQSRAQSGGGGNTANLNLLLDVTLSLTVELGRTNMFIKDVLQLSEGTIVELDKNVGEELDVLANGKPIGRGKLIVLDDYYGVQITQILDPTERL